MRQCLFIFIALLGLSAEARTIVDERGVELGLELPLSLGVHSLFQVNDLFHTRFGAGFVSEYFLTSFQKLSSAYGYLSSPETQLISNLLKNSFFFDMRLGFKPYGSQVAGGPYVEAGVSAMLYGGGLFKNPSYNPISGFDINTTLGVGDILVENYYIKSNVYNATFYLGYQIPFEERLRLNFEVGLLKILKAQITSHKSKITKQSITEEGKTKLQEFLIKNGWVAPTFSVRISFVL